MSAIALANLSWWASDADIESVCRAAASPAPDITSLHIAADPLSGKSLGRAVVHFAAASLAATVQAHITALDPNPLPGTNIQCTVLPSIASATVEAFLDEPPHPRDVDAATKAAPQAFARHAPLPFPGAPPGAPPFPPGMARMFPPGMMPPPPPAFMGGMPPPHFMWMPPAQPPKQPHGKLSGNRPRSPRAAAVQGPEQRSSSPRASAPRGSNPPTSPHDSQNPSSALPVSGGEVTQGDRNLQRSGSPSGSPNGRGGSRRHRDEERFRDREEDRDRHRDRDRDRDRDRSPLGVRREDPRRPNGLSREELDVRRARWSRDSADRDRDRVLRPGRSDRRGEQRVYEDNIEYDGHELRIPKEVRERLLERKENAERRSRRRAAIRDRSPSLSPPSPDFHERTDRGSPSYAGYRRPRSRSRSWSRSPSHSPKGHDDRRGSKRRRHADYVEVIHPEERDRDGRWRDDPDEEPMDEEEDFRDRDGDAEKSGSGRRERRRRGGRNRKRSGRSSSVAVDGHSRHRDGSRSEHHGASGKRSRTSRR